MKYALVLMAAVAMPDLNQLKQMSARFAPVPLKYDSSHLSAGDRKALPKLIEVARVLNWIFLDQIWSGNRALYEQLNKDTTPLGKARAHYFWLNKGPWSDLDDHHAFIPGVPERKPLGANFYPEDMTREEFEAWAKDDAKGFFTVIRRDANRKLTVVPYSKAYAADLEKAAALLREAAQLTENASLKHYLNLRADAFLSNDYYASDVAWMELDASIEPTIGPYEVYEDEWFNYKAAYESFIAVRDEAESAKLASFGAELQEIEDHLPIDPSLRNPKLGALAPIRVVNVVFTAGDGNRGVQTAAYNLPNDERVIREKGSKRVMLKNMQQAKFDRVLLPIAKVALSSADQVKVSFDAFFTHILMHELMHGLGPHNITVDGKATTVRQSLKDTYSTIEEAKADISGLWALQHLVDRAKLPASMAETMYTTFLASTFRSIRFGVTEAHGRGIAIQLNYLLDHGAFTVASDGTFAVDVSKIRGAVEGLTRDIMMLQARGDYAAAKAMTATATVRPEVQRVLDKLTGVPVDIAPRFTTAAELEADDQ